MTLGWNPRGEPLRRNADFPELVSALEEACVVAQERGSVWGWCVQVNVDYAAAWHSDARNWGVEYLECLGGF